jgi:NAD(P)-dependent dehydrogenase (short-subunit alcohol dehydrogenase family)
MPSHDALAGKVALITGASRGIGFAIARRLGRMGARVSICGRDQAKLDQSASGLRTEGIETLAVRADVTRGEQISSLVHRTQQELGPIDILVNNAGTGVFGPFHEFGEADWDALMDTNLKSVFLMCRAVAPEMIRRQTGQIINISSLAGKSTFANGAIYCASKWGLMGLTGSMAEDLRGYGIRVSAVCPGSVATEFPGPGGKSPSKKLQPDDVAHVVAALATQAEGSFISEVHIRPTRKP